MKWNRLFGALFALALSMTASAHPDRDRVRHVLLISVDGLHNVDVARFIAGHPFSTFAQLAQNGIRYTDAHTTTPSDSFPGLVAQVTGGTPRTTGSTTTTATTAPFTLPGATAPGTRGPRSPTSRSWNRTSPSSSAPSTRITSRAPRTRAAPASRFTRTTSSG